jgi:hypothetical protein
VEVELDPGRQDVNKDIQVTEEEGGEKYHPSKKS